MRMRTLVAATLLAVCVSVSVNVSVSVGVLRAQVKASEGANRPPAVKPAPLPAPRRSGSNPKVPPPDPVQQLRQFQALSPEQRETELAKLPLKRRENLEKQLARFDAMTPVQRERAIHKLELMQTLTPERKQAVNDAIKGLHERYDQLPSRERRQALARDLYSDEMKQKWSPTELELIHGAFPSI
jgi:hypothetical protein